jgi:hypothetical protein
MNTIRPCRSSLASHRCGPGSHPRSMWSLLWTEQHWAGFLKSSSVSPPNHSTKFIITTRGWHSTLSHSLPPPSLPYSIFPHSLLLPCLFSTTLLHSVPGGIYEEMKLVRKNAPKSKSNTFTLHLGFLETVLTFFKLHRKMLNM